MAGTRRLTTAQALVQFLTQQWVQRDGDLKLFFAGMFGIFGHGNVAGIGQALEQDGRMPYYQARNEQGMVHAAVAFAKQSRRLRAFACTSSIGPGATNMLTGAAGATISRLPVLLLPGDTFARRNVGPVLQQLESPSSQDVSVNDCFKPVSRYWDRINRPEQLITALPEAMRVLTSPVETGAVTLALPQDVQAEAFEFPEEMFEPRTHIIRRPLPEAETLAAAVEWLRVARSPLIIAGGGVVYSEAEGALADLCDRTGLPVVETQAGKGALRWDHSSNLGAIGHTGTGAANHIAANADLVLCVGTRLSDFTTASKSVFQHPDVHFIGLNINPADAAKHGARPLEGDARATLAELARRLGEAGYRVSDEYAAYLRDNMSEWQAESDRIRTAAGDGAPSQAEVIRTVNDAMESGDVVVCASGSLPGDMHRLWRPVNADQYHLEYGYSCMGYEIAGGLGVKLAQPDGEVFVMVGDGAFLMMHGELLTAVQEGLKLIVVLIENHAFGSIHGLSLACGSEGFGNEFRYRNPKTGKLDGELIDVDFVSVAKGLGVESLRVESRDDLIAALADARERAKSTVIVVPVDRRVQVPDTGAWWDVPVAEISDMPSVQEARRNYMDRVETERYFL